MTNDEYTMESAVLVIGNEDADCFVCHLDGILRNSVAVPINIKHLTRWTTYLERVVGSAFSFEECRKPDDGSTVSPKEIIELPVVVESNSFV